MKNRNPEQLDTHERQDGGHTSATGEKHNSTKGERVGEDQRGFGKVSKENSPGRVSSDVKDN